LVEGASWRQTEDQPENKTFDESRRLGLKAGLEGWQPAQAGGKPESGAEERSRRRKLETGAISGPEGRWKAQAGDRHEGGATEQAGGASRRQVRRQSWKVGGRRELEAGWKAQPEG